MNLDVFYREDGQKRIFFKKQIKEFLNYKFKAIPLKFSDS